MIRALMVATVMVMALTVSAIAAEEVPERTRPTALEGSSIAWCGDVEPIRATPGAYRDRPVYVGNEQPNEVIAWAREQPGFAGVWIDRENLGWVNLTFSRDAEARQADLLRLFPDAGAVAVAVEHTARELRQLHRRAVRELRGADGAFGVSDDVMRNVVEISVPHLTADVVAEVERLFSGEPVCLDGSDFGDQPVGGSQPDAGDGWHLIAHREGRGPVYQTGIATDERAFARLWRQARMRGSAPEVDFADHVVLWFAEPHGSSCPERRLDDIVVDPEAGLVYPLLVDPDVNLACTDDIAGSWQFLVALERSRLPAGPFMIQLGPSDPPAGAPKERTVVDIDLRQPGTVAGDDDVHFDPTIGEPKPARSGMVIEPFGEWDYAFDVSCGIGYLGEINGIHWVSDRTELPEAWQGSVGDDDELVVSIAIVAGDDAHVEASLAGATVRYDAAREAPADCGFGTGPVEEVSERSGVDDVVPALIDVAATLATQLWPDAPAPDSLAEYVPVAREQLWDEATDGLRLPLHLRFVEARCEADGPGVALIFEEIGPQSLARTYAYAARGSMPSSEEDSWGGATGQSSVLDDSEFIHLMGPDPVPCR